MPSSLRNRLDARKRWRISLKCSTRFAGGSSYAEDFVYFDGVKASPSS